MKRMKKVNIIKNHKVKLRKINNRKNLKINLKYKIWTIKGQFVFF